MINKILILLPILFALSAPGSAFGEGPPIKIGVILCLTGACQESGTNALKGIELAQEKLNAQGGILGRMVELVIQDTREMDSPANAVSAYRKIRLDADISYIIGPTWTAGGLPVAPIAARDEVILISPSVGLEKFNESAENIFNLWPHDSVSTKALAHYAIGKGWKRAAILSNTGPWESALAKVFDDEYASLGGHKTLFYETQLNDTDLRTAALKVKHVNPDVIFMSSYTQLALLGRSFQKIGISLPMMTVLLEETQVQNAQGTLEGILFAEYDGASEEFTKQYRDKFQLPVGMASDTGYDALMIYADTASKAKGFEPSLIKEQLLKTTYSGASGTIIFDSKGGVKKTPRFKRLTGSDRIPLPSHGLSGK